jgi:hypothetical protein
MHDLVADESSDLQQLYELTVGLLSDEEHITRALDWVDTILPVFASACRNAVVSDDAASVDRWNEWLRSDSALVIEEAGKGEVFDWRLHWIETLLRATRTLQAKSAWRDSKSREALAQEFWSENRKALACFPLSFWRHLTDYLSSAVSTASPYRRAVTFPLVLSEPVVDGGSETNVILAQFLLQEVDIRTGEVFLAPEQTVMRCMDARFAEALRDAAVAAKIGVEDRANDLPAVSVRVQTLKPGHERFLCGTVLRGESGGGALSVGLRQLYLGSTQASDHVAISFALRAHGSPHVDGNCHVVGATDEKVRGCAKQGVPHLLVARHQQAQLAMYGRKHNVQILGATTVLEAADAVGALAKPAPMPKPVIAAQPTEAAKPAPGTKPAAQRVVVLHYRRAERDRNISKLIEDHLTALGHSVFVDHYVDVGITWAREIDQHIRSADIVIPLLSAASIVSEVLASEIQAADEARQKHGAKPRIIPVRIGYSGPMPESISYVTESLPPVIWNSESGDAGFIAALDAALNETPFAGSRIHELPSAYKSESPKAQPQAVVEAAAPTAEPTVAAQDLEPFAGLVPLNSRFYIERDTDAPFLAAVDQQHSVILVKGARQMGKSSLLARGLARAEQSGTRVALTDFQKLSMADLQSIKGFYVAVARMLARQLRIDVALDEIWVEHRSPNLNFEEYFEDYVLPAVDGKLVWAMDEVDKLFFSTDFSSDVFGLLRSWANERQGRVNSPWAGLTMAIAYATEAHLFITDINQSPFNVGTRFEMKDFTSGQVAELNRRYGSPIRNDAELDAFYHLVGGHPYLVRRSLYAMVTEKLDVPGLEEAAASDNGPLSDHLRRILTLLARNVDNVAAVRDILAGKPCPNFETFYHLRSAGILLGETVQSASIRCNLYRMYLSRHL